MKRVEQILAWLFLVLMSLLATCAIIEVLARNYLWNHTTEAEFRVLASINQIKQRYGDDVFVQAIDNRKFSWSPHHYLGYIPTPNYERDQNKHNALGFRGDEITVAKPDGIYRIVAIGGSTTYSIDVPDYRDSYPDLVEDYLWSYGYDHTEVINAGIIAQTSYQNLLNLEFRILHLEPDLIIVYQGFNDIEARFVYPYERYLGDNSGAERPFISDTIMPDIVEYSTALRILGIRTGLTRSHSALDWYYAKHAESNHVRQFKRQYYRDEYPSDIFEQVSAREMLDNNPPVHFERNLKNMLTVAEINNVDVLLVTMVLAEDFHGRSGILKNRIFSSDEFSFAMAQHNDVTREAAASTGTPLLDMADVFPDDLSLFTDGLHMNIDGNHVRAQLIGEIVIREFLS